uniref:hypothetical protein n=1 Tax=Burkholderia diffusa TaxID=488732 RepID=UPI001CC70027|nr:hypothetical protein [Burkholderia diffusa]
MQYQDYEGAEMIEMLLMAAIFAVPMAYITAWALHEIARIRNDRPKARRKLDRNWPWN